MDIITELCSDVPDIDLRNILRSYNPRNGVKQHKAEFRKCQKPVMIITLAYLRVTVQNQFTKPACISTFMCCTQNLLLDKSDIYECEYVAKQDEISL